MEVVRELIGSTEICDGFSVEGLKVEVDYLRARYETELDKYDTVEEEVHADSYDEYSSYMEVRLYGIRQKTQAEIDKEKASIAESKAIRAIEDELDISYHEASLVNRLKRQGKIK